MFNFGIRSVMVALACPGARRVQVVQMVNDALGIVYPSGKVEWLPMNDRGLFDGDEQH